MRSVSAPLFLFNLHGLYRMSLFLREGVVFLLSPLFIPSCLSMEDENKGRGEVEDDEGRNVQGNEKKAGGG